MFMLLILYYCDVVHSDYDGYVFVNCGDILSWTVEYFYGKCYFILLIVGSSCRAHIQRDMH